VIELDYKKDLIYAYKALVFLIAFGLVVYAIIVFGDYMSRFRKLFLVTGKWEWVAYITIFLLALGWILRYLLRWEFRLQAGIKKKPKRRK
jgi:hypothetical protein